MILVAGATGFLGMAISRRLTDKGLSVRALARPTSDAAKVDQLKSLGASLVLGNLKDRKSLAAACQGIDTVITTVTTVSSRQPGDSIPATDQAGQINLVDAAKAAGVRHFIYVSYSKNINTECPLTTAKRAVEQRVMASGMTYTILRPSYFMEAWLSPALGFDYLNGKVQIYGADNHLVSWISLGDVAAFAVVALDHPAAQNTILELGGPQALSPLEVVQIFEKVQGKRFTVTHVPEETLRAQKAQATDPLQQSFCALMLDYAKGDVIDMRTTAKLLPLPLMSVEEYAHRVLVPSQ